MCQAQGILESIRRTLHGCGQNWRLSFAACVDDALVAISSGDVDVVITDFNMAHRDGFDLMRVMAEKPEWRQIPVLVLTGNGEHNLKRKALQAGAFDLINKPISKEDLIARISSVLRTKRYADELSLLNATLERKVIERTRAVEQSRTDILLCLAMAGECRDSDTGRHLARVARYASALAQHFGLPDDEVRRIFLMSPLHDIGKLGIPDHILRKPGTLTASERTVMQTHCVIGHRILTRPSAIVAGIISDDEDEEAFSNPLLHESSIIALNHHEWWDGSGYPTGIAGTAIPLNARIVAIADVYDALTTCRPYKAAIRHEVAVNMILDAAGQHFDPKLSAAFESIVDKFNVIRLEWCDEIVSMKSSFSVAGLSRAS